MTGTISMTQQASSEAVERRLRSEEVLTTDGVPIAEYLPVIETEAESTLRTVDELARRALALLIVAAKGAGMEQSQVEKLIESYGIAADLSPEESAFAYDPMPSEDVRLQFNWRYEAAWPLLWALGYVEELGKPDDTCDVQLAVGLVRNRTTQQVIAGANLRPLREILDQADLIYCYHWAVVDARINGRIAPAGLHPGVAYERHYALNWMIGYEDQPWDEISTDT